MNILSFIRRTCDAWYHEIKSIFTDEGALLFSVLLPLAYPLLYSWVYNNEVVREVPVAIVDDSHSALSREFIQKYDASPDVRVEYHFGNVEEAKAAVGHGDVYGFLYFPEDFAKKTGRMEQTHVSVYCDMSYMLAYKAVYQTANNVSLLMGSEIQQQLQGSTTAREAEIAAHPLLVEEVPIFNTTQGYGNSLLPVVLIVIIQQAMFLAVGLLVGRDRERRFESVRGVFCTLIGKGSAYIMVFSVMFAYVTLVVPDIFGYVSMVQGKDLILLATPYLLACTFLAFLVSDLIRYRENVMLVVVFTSLIFIFLTGISWPQSSIPGFWQGVASLVPSTFAARAFVRMNSMGAHIGDVAFEVRALWIHTVVYGIIAALIMYRRRLINLNLYPKKH